MDTTFLSGLSFLLPTREERERERRKLGGVSPYIVHKVYQTRQESESHNKALIISELAELENQL